jgi:hypothetical protein
MPAGDKYNLILLNADHGGVGHDSGPPPSPEQEWLRLASLYFWKAYLAGSAQSKTFLQRYPFKGEAQLFWK